MRTIVAALTLLAAPLTSPRASAAEVARSDDGTVVVEVGGFYKSYGSWLVMPPSLVEAVDVLADVVDDTRALLPPEAAGAVPPVSPLPAHVGLSTQTARLQGLMRIGEHLTVEGAWQLSMIASTAAAFGAGSTQAGVLGTALVVPQRRFVDFEPFLVDEGSLRLQHNLDRLSLAYESPELSVVVGRQVLSWGTGLLWNPTDLLSPFAPTDVDREVRRGVDAVRVSVPVGVLGGLELLWLPQQRPDDQGFVARARGNLSGVDLSTTAAKYVDDFVLGADVAFDLGAFGVYAEGALTLPIARPDDAFGRAVAGGMWRPTEALVLTGEAYWNGFGAADADDIVTVLQDPRVVRGEVFGAGRVYGGLVASYAVDELTSLSSTTIVNVFDPGLLWVPAVEVWLEQQVLLRAGGFVPLAAGVDVDRFRALTPQDLLQGSDAFQSLTTGFGARSEYGLQPYGAFVQLGAYLP
jgi:hypothetical protein